MKKIPTLYKRNTEDRSRVTDEVNPGCEWVLAGEGVATRKWNGTCMMFDGSQWWARREVKPNQTAPENFVPIETDDITGKTVGWVPAETSAFAKFWLEALAAIEIEPDAGTYELIGPKINGNPDQVSRHLLVKHGAAMAVGNPFFPERTPRELVEKLATLGIEGVVWYHPDGRMAKLKARDYGIRVTAWRKDTPNA